RAGLRPDRAPGLSDGQRAARVRARRPAPRRRSARRLPRTCQRTASGRRQGCAVWTLARRARAGVVDQDRARAPALTGRGAMMVAHVSLALSAPRAYAATLALALRLAAPGLRGRLWQLFYFAEAVMLWSECRRRGLRHVHAHLANVAADVALLAAELGSRVDRARPWSWSFTMHGPTEFYDLTRFRL